MTKANSWRGHNTSLPPSPSQALATTCPSRTKTKAEEELFVLKLRERKCPIPKKIRWAHRPKKSAFKRVDSDQFQIGTRSRAGSMTPIKPGPSQIGSREDRARRLCKSPAALQGLTEIVIPSRKTQARHSGPTMFHSR